MRRPLFCVCPWGMGGGVAGQSPWIDDKYRVAFVSGGVLMNQNGCTPRGKGEKRYRLPKIMKNCQYVKECRARIGKKSVIGKENRRKQQLYCQKDFWMRRLIGNFRDASSHVGRKYDMGYVIVNRIVDKTELESKKLPIRCNFSKQHWQNQRRFGNCKDGYGLEIIEKEFYEIGRASLMFLFYRFSHRMTAVGEVTPAGEAQLTASPHGETIFTELLS